MCSRRQLKWVVFALLCACSCSRDSGEARLRAEARTFLKLYEAVHLSDQEAQRAARISALAAAPLSDENVRHARDLCVAGQRELLQQEQLQEANSSEIDRALASSKQGAPLDPSLVERLRAKVTESEQALRRAQDQLHACEAATRSLSLRFAPR